MGMMPEKCRAEEWLQGFGLEQLETWIPPPFVPFSNGKGCGKPKCPVVSAVRRPSGHFCKQVWSSEGKTHLGI